MNILRKYKIKLWAFGFWLLAFGCFTGGQVMSQEVIPETSQEKEIKKNELQFATTGYLYEQCVDALKKNQDNPEAFSKTYCAAHISGFVGAVILYSWIIPVHNPEDQCETEKLKIYKKIQGRFCLPEDLSLIRMAMDFVNWIETAEFQVPREDALKNPGMLGMTSAFDTLYNCKLKNEKGGENGMDD